MAEVVRTLRYQIEGLRQSNQELQGEAATMRETLRDAFFYLGGRGTMAEQIELALSTDAGCTFLEEQQALDAIAQAERLTAEYWEARFDWNADLRLQLVGECYDKNQALAKCIELMKTWIGIALSLLPFLPLDQPPLHPRFKEAGEFLLTGEIDKARKALGLEENVG